MVNKSTRAAGTGSVHSLLYGRSVECNLCIFAAQFDGHIRLRNQGLHRFTAGDYFLFKANAEQLCQRQSAGTGNHRLHFHIALFIQKLLQQFPYFLEHVGHVPFVSRIHNLVVLIENQQFYRC